MSSVITIQVGGAGNRIGLKFWERLFSDHHVNAQGQPIGSFVDDGGTFFVRNSGNRRTPRVVAVDGALSDLDSFRNSPLGGAVPPDSYLGGDGPGGGNFASGYHHGGELLGPVLARVGNLVAALGTPATFLIFHSLGGGVGGGFTSLLTESLRQAYPDCTIVCASVLSGTADRRNVIEVYTAGLTLWHLSRHADMVLLLDNPALAAAVTSVDGSVQAGFDRHNEFAARAVALATTPIRRPIDRRVHARELARMLVPRKGLNLVGMSVESWGTGTSGSPVTKLVQASSRISGFNPADGRSISPVCIGRVSHSLKPTALRGDARLRVASWYPGFVPVIQTASSDRSALLLENHTGFIKTLTDLVNDYDGMSRRKSHFSAFTSKGMDESEFSSAKASLASTFTQYRGIA